MASKSYDCVVIGSGLGGLTAAAVLAKAGRSVCVLERNHSMGGAASMFKVGALTIEASLHQTADPRDPNEPKHHLLKRLGILDELTWVPVGPLYTIEGGSIGAPFELPVGFDQASAAMAARFPASARGSAHMLAEMKRLNAGVAHLMQAREERSATKLARGAFELRSLIGDWRSSLGDVLRRDLAGDEAAKLAIAGNLGYYADDADKTWWPFYAIAQGGYFASGGAYIKGGSRTLSMRLARVVTRAGGAVMLGREATSIGLDAAGKPAFVLHKDPSGKNPDDQIACTAVLANCAPSVLGAMLPDKARDTLETPYTGRPLSVSLFSAHFGLTVPPASLGLTSYSTILVPEWAKSLDDMPASTALMGEDPGGRLPIMGIANYAAVENGLDEGGPALVSVVGCDRLGNWTSLTREAEKERRNRWLDAILAALEKRFPGFAAAAQSKMFMNARSMHGFLNTPDGAVYGFAPEPPSGKSWSIVAGSPRTALPGIFLASSFGGSGGFTGAMLAGEEAARMAMAGVVRS